MRIHDRIRTWSRAPHPISPFTARFSVSSDDRSGMICFRVVMSSHLDRSISAVINITFRPSDRIKDNPPSNLEAAKRLRQQSYVRLQILASHETP